jgi:hypothetical protein
VVYGISPIPLFDAKKQPKTPNQSDRRPNEIIQVIDLTGAKPKFPYTAEQRNLAAEQGIKRPNSGTAAEFVCRWSTSMASNCRG